MSLIQFNQFNDVDIYYCFAVLYIFAIRNLCHILENCY